jgi:hypothetical protein
MAIWRSLWIRHCERSEAISWLMRIAGGKIPRRLLRHSVPRNDMRGKSRWMPDQVRHDDKGHKFLRQSYRTRIGYGAGIQ